MGKGIYYRSLVLTRSKRGSEDRRIAKRMTLRKERHRGRQALRFELEGLEEDLEEVLEVLEEGLEEDLPIVEGHSIWGDYPEGWGDWGWIDNLPYFWGSRAA